MPMPRVAVFGEDFNNYVTIARGLTKGFQQLGCESYAGFSLLSASSLTEFTDQFHPDIIIEVNRSYNQIADFEEKVQHVSWVIDFAPWERELHVGFGGSTMTYLITDPEVCGLNEEQLGRYGYMFPAVDPDIFTFSEDLPSRWDVTTIAFLNFPVSDAERDLNIRVMGKSICRFGHLVDDVLSAGLRLDSFDEPKLRAFLSERLELYSGIRGAEAPANIVTFVYNRLLRTIDRAELMHSVVRSARRVAFFGIGGWKAWPELAPHYRRPVYKASERVEIYANSRLTAHNCVHGMHDRVMEAMACGSVILINRHARERGPAGLCTHFTPDEDFLFYSRGDVEDVIGDAIADDGKIQAIRRNARKHVISNHTWRHRASQVLTDLGYL